MLSRNLCVLCLLWWDTLYRFYFLYFASNKFKVWATIINKFVPFVVLDILVYYRRSVVRISLRMSGTVKHDVTTLPTISTVCFQLFSMIWKQVHLINGFVVGLVVLIAIISRLTWLRVYYQTPQISFTIMPWVFRSEHRTTYTLD